MTLYIIRTWSTLQSSSATTHTFGQFGAAHGECRHAAEGLALSITPISAANRSPLLEALLPPRQ